MPIRWKLKISCLNVPSDFVGHVDTLITCDHGFAKDGTPFLSLSNARTGKPIRNEDELVSASELILDMVGPVREFDIGNRRNVLFELPINGNSISIGVSDAPTTTLLCFSPPASSNSISFKFSYLDLFNRFQHIFKSFTFTENEADRVNDKK